MSRIAFLGLLLVVPHASAQELPLVRGVEGQPLVAQVMRLKEPLAVADRPLHVLGKNDLVPVNPLTQRIVNTKKLFQKQECYDRASEKSEELEG